MAGLKRTARTAAVYLLSVVFALLAGLLWPLRLARKLVHGRGLSLWTGVPILTLPLKAKAERLLGVDARSMAVKTFHLGGGFDYDLSRWRSLPIVGVLVPFCAFLWASVRADRIHCFCDGALLPPPRPFEFNLVELALYRLFGVQVFLWTYGADVRTRARTRALGEPNCCTDCTQVGEACICNEARQVSKMARLGARATAVFSMGDMTEYTPGSRNDVFFWPIDLTENAGGHYTPAYPRFNGRRPLRVVHAANHRMFKGTRFLERAVDELHEEGVALELVTVEGVANAEALEIFRTADLIFDQCLIGFHGYFALEGMALGKPVMCFIRKPEYLLAPQECPIVSTHVATLKEDLRRLASAPERLAERGRRGREYVEKYFTVEAVSERLGRAYRELGVTP
jgi:hypothetical protein